MERKGLTDPEVNDRIRAGYRNGEERKASQGYAEIFLRNLLTPFNIILFALGAALIILYKDYVNAAAATGIIVFNILISTVQEWRAKRRLDRIAVLLRPKAVVVRNGEDTVIDRSDIVMDDLVHLSAGEQAQVDGEVLEERGIEMDESLLTGESSTRRKHPGDTIYSGSACVTGECWFRVTKVGDDTFSAKMTSAARKFEKKITPLQTETNAVTELLMMIAFLFLIAVIVLDFLRGNFDLGDSIKHTVVILDIVPIALFLLITLTYMMAAVRMADSGVLLQNSASVESMSHVDTVCMDKTGTITTNNLVFDSIRYYSEDRGRVDSLIRRFMTATGSKNRTVTAITDAFGLEECELLDEVQFSSDRKFSAVRVRKDGKTDTVFMGAWPFLKDRVRNPAGVEERISDYSSMGLRSVVIFDAGDAEIHRDGETAVPELTVAAVIAIRDEIRPNCREILADFTKNGMDVKVISGDDPETVEALFALARIPGERKRISGDTLDGLQGEEYSKAVLETNIFGRMRPEQKEQVVDCLRKNGRYVAMVGDGINDVRSIKRANVGVSVETGSGAARGVADMILMNDDFKALPKAIAEGKRTVSGMRDILRLYLSRNFVLMALVFVMLIVLDKTPMIPIQNTMYAFLTVSIAAFFLTIFSKPTEGEDTVLPGVIRYVAPTMLTIVVFGSLVYMGTMLAVDNGIIDTAAIFDDMRECIRNAPGFFDFSKYLQPGYLEEMICDSDVGYTDEAFARNAMLIFLIMAGIWQLFICFPLSKRLSFDRNYTRRYLPTFLGVLMFAALFALFFYVPYITCTFLRTVVFPPEVFAAIFGASVVWAVIEVAILKSRRMEGFNAWVDGLARRFLAKSEKRMNARRQARAEREAAKEAGAKAAGQERSADIAAKLAAKRREKEQRLSEKQIRAHERELAKKDRKSGKG